MGSGAPRASPAEGSSDEVHVEAVVARSRLHHRRRGGGGRQSGAGWLGRRRARRPDQGVRPSGRTGTDQRPAAARSPHRGERHPGRSQQGVSAAAAVQGQGERPDGLVHAPRRLRPGDRPRSRRQLRAQARQHRHRLPRLRADGDARLTLARPEQVRAGARQLPRRARLQPDPDRHPRSRRIPARQVPARRRGGQRVQPVHPHRRLADRLQRPHRRHRRRPVRRRPPHRHR